MMKTKLWIDDLRPPPDDTWEWAKDLGDTWDLLDMQEFELISFDHDLGGDQTTMPIARWIEEQANEGKRQPPKWAIHSANPVGRQNLEAALTSADTLWEWRTSKADGYD